MPLDPRRIEVIDDATVAAMRRLKPPERLAMANRMVIQARDAITHHLKSKHPEWDAERLRTEVRRRMSRGPD